MKSILYAGVCAATLMVGGQALADDATPAQSKEMAMKDCMAKQHAADGQMPMKDAQSLCEAKIKDAMDPTGTKKVGSGKPDKP